MQVFFFVAYLVIGIVQLFAIMDGLQYALSLNIFFAALVAIFITYIPLVGSIAGIYGALNVWDWTLLQAGALFFWYVPAYMAFMAVLGVASALERKS